jgi:thiamine biosynthesis lipoprotein
MVGPRADGPPPLRKMILPGLFVLALFIVVFVRGRDVRTETVLRGEAMGTTWTVKVAGEALDPSASDRALNAITDALDNVNTSMSTYRDDSDLSRFNRHPAQQAFQAPAPLLTVIDEALRISKLTDGAFDITVSPLVDAWGFGPQGQQEPPNEDTLAAIATRVGWSKLTRQGDTLVKSHDDLHCDLSAIAKGFAVDNVINALVALGHKDLLVEVGGEISARGTNRRHQPWRLGIEVPTSDTREVFAVVSLQDHAMATSGDYRNFYETDGVRRSHTIDPRTGHPVDHTLASVTVIHPSGMTADGWATALMVLGEEQGRALAEREGLAAHFIVRTQEGTFTASHTPAFEAMTSKSRTRKHP